MNKQKLLFFGILTLAFTFRFFKLGEIPNGFYSDEAVYGYNAYSIGITGKDEYGEMFPLAFRSFGDYKAPLYIYFTVPFVYLFGLTEYAVRLPSALLGVVLVILVYRLAKAVLYKDTAAQLLSFFVAVSPFTLQFSRMAHENNLVVVLIVLGILSFIWSTQKASLSYLIVCSIAFAASVYAYHDARVFVPLFLLLLFISYIRFIKDHARHYVIAGIVYCLLCLPLVITFGNPDVLSRAKKTNIFSDSGVALTINDERGEDEQADYFVPALFHNKAVEYGLRFARNYLSHFSPDFLFFQGEAVKIYNTPENGILLITTLPFLCLGFCSFFVKKFHFKKLFLFWFFLASVPASLTRFVPSASRTMILAPVINYTIVLGVLNFIEYIKYSKIKRVYMTLISIIIAFNIAYYLHYYYINMPVRYAKEWHYGMKEVISEVQKREGAYDNVWFSKNAWGYMYPLFYMKFPPEKYQPQSNLGPLNEYGFGWVKGFDKYIFNDFPEEIEEGKNTLFIGTPSDFGGDVKPLHTVHYPNGEAAFYIVGT